MTGIQWGFNYYQNRLLAFGGMRFITSTLLWAGLRVLPCYDLVRFQDLFQLLSFVTGDEKCDQVGAESKMGLG